MNKIATTLFLLVLLSLAFVFIGWQRIYLPLDSSDTAEKLFLVEKGRGIFEIASDLEEEQIIKCKFSFTVYSFLTDQQNNLQAGEYSLNSSMTIPEISSKIASGEVIKEAITIPEGWNLRDMAWYFENRGMFQAEELFELVGFPLIDYSKATDLPKPKDFSSQFDFLKDKPKAVGLEGYLFPDTYFVSRPELKGIVINMLYNFGERFDQELRNETEKQGKTIFEVLTMASLVEKEVRTLEDKEKVSGILWKRIENSFPLQVDATIIYIIGKKTTKVSKEETKIDSPYNTYKYRGLPLGPICNPGLESILAVLYPESSEFWYYLSTPEGETIFSKTLEEHNIAKAKYLN